MSEKHKPYVYKYVPLTNDLCGIIIGFMQLQCVICNNDRYALTVDGKCWDCCRTDVDRGLLQFHSLQWLML